MPILLWDTLKMVLRTSILNLRTTNQYRQAWSIEGRDVSYQPHTRDTDLDTRQWSSLTAPRRILAQGASIDPWTQFQPVQIKIILHRDRQKIITFKGPEQSTNYILPVFLDIIKICGRQILSKLTSLKCLWVRRWRLILDKASWGLS